MEPPLTRKMVPLQGERAHSLYYWSFQKQNREEGGTEHTQHQFTQGYNILHRLQVHHLTLTFILNNKKNEHLIYIHIYIHIRIVIVNFINDNASY